MKKVTFTVCVLSCTAFLSSAIADSKSETLAQIEALKSEIEELEQGNKEIIQLGKNIELLNQDRDKKKTEVLSLEKELSELNYLTKIYKSSYRVVPKVSPGSSLGTVVLPNGITINNAVFSAVVRGGIQVTSSGGPTNISVEQIPQSHADKFNLPAQIASPSMTLQQLAALRPNDQLGALKSQKAVAESAQTTVQGGGDIKPAVPKPVSTPKPVSKVVPESETDESTAAKLARNDQRWLKIDQLKNESRSVNQQRKTLMKQRRQQEREFQMQSIKPDKSKVQKILGGFDEKILGLEDRDREIAQEITRIRRSLE